ncbi:MAG TPA: four-helix bundle copper-binding protein [Phycisphaerae bacterium]|nr:four-helix bundle copper-binding protein [Phycisphaerae bacterium]
MDKSANREMQTCVENCLNCYKTCEETKGYCLRKGGRHSDPDRLSLMADCAKICMTSADFMIRSSSNHAEVCGVCSSICEQCATDCRQMGDDARMQACAQVCQHCAESCQQMAGQTTGA